MPGRESSPAKVSTATEKETPQRVQEQQESPRKKMRHIAPVVESKMANDAEAAPKSRHDSLIGTKPESIDLPIFEYHRKVSATTMQTLAMLQSRSSSTSIPGSSFSPHPLVGGLPSVSSISSGSFDSLQLAMYAEPEGLNSCGSDFAPLDEMVDWSIGWCKY